MDWPQPKGIRDSIKKKESGINIAIDKYKGLATVYSVLT